MEAPVSEAAAPQALESYQPPPPTRQSGSRILQAIASWGLRPQRRDTQDFLGVRSGCPVLLLTALPTAYVWLLPLLASESIGFAHRCSGLPRCEDSVTGMSISDLIATPQATGAMAAVFFWPTFRMWSMKGAISDLTRWRLCLGLLLAFYIFFELCLLLPVTLYRTQHLVCRVVYSGCAVAFFSVLLWHFRGRELFSFRLMLAANAALALCYPLVHCAALLAQLAGHPTLVRDLAPWLMYVVEASGLSCLSLLPWFWQVESDSSRSSFSHLVRAEGGAPPAEGSSGPPTDTFRSLKQSRVLRPVLALLAVTPLAYVWSLPLVALTGSRFLHYCPGLPRCENSNLGMSVSDFIATPQATGAMAAVNFWPMAHLWSHKGDFEDRRRHFALLMAFYAFFGMFLAAPVTVYPTVHACVVLCFCVSGLGYYRGLLPACHQRSLLCCRVLLRVSISAFWGVVLTNLAAACGRLWGRPYLVRDAVPWLFYVFEATGLSSMSIFPWFWHVQSGSFRP